MRLTGQGESGRLLKVNQFEAPDQSFLLMKKCFKGAALLLLAVFNLQLSTAWAQGTDYFWSGNVISTYNQ